MKQGQSLHKAKEDREATLLKLYREWNSKIDTIDIEYKAKIKKVNQEYEKYKDQNK